MAYLSKYGVARKIRIPMVKRGVVDHAVSADWTPAAGDVKISKDGGSAANVTNLPTAIAMGNSTIWEFSLTATEMQAAQINVTIADSSTKAVEDSAFDIETYGNASAQHAVDLADSVRAGLTALPNAAAEAAGGLFTRGTGAGQINQDANGRIDANAKAWAGTATTLSSGVPDVNIKTITAGIIAAASFAANALDAVWSTATRVLTAGTNIALAKGTGVTGFNDLDASGVRGAVGLASANLDTQLAAIAGYIDTEVGAIKTQTDKFTFTGGLVQADVQDWKGATAPAMTGDAYAALTGAQSEPGQGAPAVNAPPLTKLAFLYKAWRNKKTQTASTLSLFADDATTVDQKATVSDDGTTFTSGEIASGP